jgi:hypothetical protein
MVWVILHRLWSYACVNNVFGLVSPSKNLTKWILLAHHVQGLTCILQDLWKLSKVGIYFKMSHDAFKSYSYHWDIWLLGYRFHGSISSIIWFLVHISRSRLCFKMDRGNSKSKQWSQNSDKVFERKYFESIGIPRAMISDGGTHFCNKSFESLIKKYEITHKVAPLSSSDK